MLFLQNLTGVVTSSGGFQKNASFLVARGKERDTEEIAGRRPQNIADSWLVRHSKAVVDTSSEVRVRKSSILLVQPSRCSVRSGASDQLEYNWCSSRLPFELCISAV